MLSPHVDPLYVSASFASLSYFPQRQQSLLSFSRKDKAHRSHFSMFPHPHTTIQKQTSIHNMSGHGANGIATAIKLAAIKQSITWYSIDDL